MVAIVTTLTTPGAGSWPVPLDCPPGTLLTVEEWAAGAGANGQTSTSFGAGGGGGGYASSVIRVDARSSYSYSIGAGSNGGTGANPAAGGNTSFSVSPNLISNTTNVGIVTGTPGTLPTGLAIFNQNGLTTSVIGSGIDTNGLPYLDISFVGTTTATGSTQLNFGNVPISPSTQYTFSGSLSFVGGSLTNVTSFGLNVDTETLTGSYLATPINPTPAVTSTSTRFQGTATSGATAFLANLYVVFGYTTGTAINVTLRYAGFQFEAAAAASTFTTTPPTNVLASGGQGPVGNTGGLGGAVSNSMGTTKFAGGAGAAFNASGSGGGGGAGKDGAGQVGTTAGVGGHGDGTSVGGAGGAVKTTSPGNPGTANVEGGGGGGGLTTAAGTGGAGGAPGGGGGGTAVASGTGGAGARGQIRLTYTSVPPVPFNRFNRLMTPILAQ